MIGLNKDILSQHVEYITNLRMRPCRRLEAGKVSYTALAFVAPRGAALLRRLPARRPRRVLAAAG